MIYDYSDYSDMMYDWWVKCFYKTFRRYCSMCQDGCGRTGNNDTAAESLKWGIVFHAIGFRQQQPGQVGSWID